MFYVNSVYPARPSLEHNIIPLYIIYMSILRHEITIINHILYVCNTTVSVPKNPSAYGVHLNIIQIWAKTFWKNSFPSVMIWKAVCFHFWGTRLTPYIYRASPNSKCLTQIRLENYHSMMKKLWPESYTFEINVFTFRAKSWRHPDTPNNQTINFKA